MVLSHKQNNNTYFTALPVRHDVPAPEHEQVLLVPEPLQTVSCSRRVLQLCGRADNWPLWVVGVMSLPVGMTTVVVFRLSCGGRLQPLNQELAEHLHKLRQVSLQPCLTMSAKSSQETSEHSGQVKFLSAAFYAGSSFLITVVNKTVLTSYRYVPSSYSYAVCAHRTIL